MFTLVQTGEYDWNDEICKNYIQISNSMDCSGCVIVGDALQEMIEIMHLLSQTIFIALSSHKVSSRMSDINRSQMSL